MAEGNGRIKYDELETWTLDRMGAIAEDLGYVSGPRFEKVYGDFLRGCVAGNRLPQFLRVLFEGVLIRCDPPLDRLPREKE